MIRVLFLSFSLVFCATSLPCQESPSNDSPKTQEFNPKPFQDDEEQLSLEEKNTPLDSKSLLIKTILLLGGLVGALYGGAYLIRRIGGSRFSSSRNEGEILLIERQYLSPKTSVWLIEVKGQHVIVVDGQNGVAVHTLSTKENSA